MPGEDDTTPPGVPTTTKDPYTGLHAESVYAMWHDPTTYDPIRHGPPYLPDMKGKTASFSDRKAVRSVVRGCVQKMSVDEITEINAILDQVKADFGPTPMSELATLLAFITAESTIHQAHHWQTRGESFYADHELFSRIYGDVYVMIDGLAERMVGSGHYILAHPILLAKHCSMVVQSFYRDAGANPSADMYPLFSLRACLRTLVALKTVYAALEEKGQLSHGIDNLLQGYADKHEDHVYLLKQRLQSKTASYDRR